MHGRSLLVAAALAALAPASCNRAAAVLHVEVAIGAGIDPTAVDLLIVRIWVGDAEDSLNRYYSAEELGTALYDGATSFNFFPTDVMGGLEARVEVQALANLEVLGAGEVTAALPAERDSAEARVDLVGGDGSDGGMDGGAPVPTCGDGVAEGTEACDGTDLRGADCVSEGHAGGVLGCGADCALVPIGCFDCGDGTLDAPGEECDGTDLGGQTCASLGMGFVGGVLACDGGCNLDVSGCEACGNGVVDAGEECDGTNLDGETCVSLSFASGTLRCTGACALDVGLCTACGNGVRDAGEECDGAAFAPGTSCVSLGFASGTLGCSGLCDAVVTTLCTAPASCGDSACEAAMSETCLTCPGDCGQCCGNGAVDVGEDCDGALLGGATCASLGFAPSGTVACGATGGAAPCRYDTSACTACGNGSVDGGEACDGTNLFGASCASLGFAGGTLACDAGCALETSGCETCGNGVLDDASESCDGTDLGVPVPTCPSLGLGYSGGTLACLAGCAFDESGCWACGDGGVDPGEQCDGPNLGGATCGSLAGAGYTAGTLGCTSGCLYDESACSTCGNDVREGAEACDGTDFGGASCSSRGFAGGVLVCAPDCGSFDDRGCWRCGDGAAQGSEACDGGDLGGETCASLGFEGGALACNLNCTYDLNGCMQGMCCPTYFEPSTDQVPCTPCIAQP